VTQDKALAPTRPKKAYFEKVTIIIKHGRQPRRARRPRAALGRDARRVEGLFQAGARGPRARPAHRRPSPAAAREIWLPGDGRADQAGAAGAGVFGSGPGVGES